MQGQGGKLKLSQRDQLELLSQLTLEHQNLKARVKKLEGQFFRTRPEELEISELKKRKLLTKDRIFVLQQN